MNSIFSPMRVTGLDKIDTSKPHIYAVNHASAMDIPVLYVNLPFQFRIAFKKELLAYPVIGWQLKRSGQVCIDQQPLTFHQQYPRRLEGAAAKFAAGDFSGRRTHSGWRDQALSARSIFPRHQGSGRHRSHRAGRHL